MSPTSTVPKFRRRPLQTRTNQDKRGILVIDQTIYQNLRVEIHRMADPFEVRMRFSSQLQHLNASVTSAQKAAQYALKYRDMSEDLHSCILEQLERVSFFFF